VVKKIALGLGTAAVISAVCGVAYADEDIILRQVAGEACDARQADDDARTAENRALDKAGLDAVRKSGVVQEYYQNLSEQALNLISYRIIDEYLSEIEHQKTKDDATQVCVKMNAQLEITTDELVELINEYKYSAVPTEAQIAEITEEVKQQTQFKPQNLNDKKLVYIAPLKFWNDLETDNYKSVLRDALEHSEYFFVTEDEKMADYVLKPLVDEAKVDAIDAKHRKMKMILLLDLEAPNDKDFGALQEEQKHFILFAADKSEQQVADTLIKKLLSRAATAMVTKLDKQIERRLEEEKLHGK
jgi:hypothetical protein